MAQLVKVQIDETTAEVNIDLIGFHGKGCDALLKAFSQVGKLTKETIKPEYRQQVQGSTIKA
jgi:hypothetical protein